jgi:hypothetical protein
MIPSAEYVFSKCKWLVYEHDEEEGELEGVELLFGFDKVMAALVDHVPKVVLHFLVSDKLQVDWV